MIKDKFRDEFLFLLEQELKCHKAIRTVYRERLLHEDYLINDIEKQISEYQDNNNTINKELLG